MANIELEQALLGAILINNECYDMVSSFLKPEHFQEEIHQDIYQRITARIANAMVANPTTLAPAMKNHDGLKELGGVAYLARIAGAATNIQLSDQYARMLVEEYHREQMISSMRGAIEELENGEMSTGDVAEVVISTAATASYALSTEKPLIGLGDAIVESVQQTKDIMDGKVFKATTGLEDLDKKMGGLTRGDLTLLGGRPSMGKTSLALAMCMGGARAGYGQVFNSLEMQRAELASRAISELSGVQYYKARNGWVSDEEFRTMVESAKGAVDINIWVTPPSIRSIDAICNVARRHFLTMKDKGLPVGALFVDYLGLIETRFKERRDQLREVSNRLKGLAISLDIPVVALSQLSRGVESRDDKRPMLSDLRESGDLEQDADNVLFCYREYHYKSKDKTSFKKKNGDIDDEKLADHEAELARLEKLMTVIIAKQRMGPIEEVDVGCDIKTNRVWDLSVQRDLDLEEGKGFR